MSERTQRLEVDAILARAWADQEGRYEHAKAMRHAACVRALHALVRDLTHEDTPARWLAEMRVTRIERLLAEPRADHPLELPDFLWEYAYDTPEEPDRPKPGVFDPQGPWPQVAHKA